MHQHPNLPENCELHFLVFVDAHHMGSADRCQAPSIPRPTLVAPHQITGLVECAEQRFVRLTRRLRSEFWPQINAALLKRQRGIWRPEPGRDRPIAATARST